MRSLKPRGNSTKIAIAALMLTGIVLSASSRAADAGLGTISRQSGSLCSPMCFENVDYNSQCNQLTGITDFQAVLGTYEVCGTNTYSSFGATTPQATGKPSGLPSYPPGDFFPQNDGSNGSYDINLQGLDNGQKNLNGAVMVGSWKPGASLCSATTCGVWHVFDGSWTSISDPNEGNGPCAVTQLLAINDSKVAVGYYEQNSTQLDNCTQQAFEMYPDPNGSGYIYEDLTPLTPSGSKPVSSEATSINQLNDIAGIETWQSGTQTYTSGWVYVDLGYYSHLCYSGCTAPNTYALGINFNDDVVGYYTNGSGTFGFFTGNPENTSPKFAPINDTNNGSSYTIVRAINTNCLVAGTTKGNGGKLHGFVGYPSKGCNYDGTDRSSRRLRK